MATVLPRIQVTCTPAVDAALGVASRRWPGAPKSEQLTRMLAIAMEAIATENAERLIRRRTAVHESSGAFDYGPNYLADLRADNRE